MTNDNQQDGAKGAELIISMYDDMINRTHGNLPALQTIYRMALESETLDQWPIEQRQRLIDMFDEAVRMAEDDFVSTPADGTTFH